MINVTKTYLPPYKVYEKYLKKIWKKGWVTNHGPMVLLLEDKLKKYFGVKHLFFVSNGTIGLQIALEAIGCTGEIITTPFSYVATTSSISWQKCTPIFADINENTWCINPTEIESKITKNTSAILATHVFGIPCDVERIQKISRKYHIPVIYDAAHAFGVKYNKKTILSWGNISVLSFHATKLFHTIEGGAIVTNDDSLARKILYMRNFGHVGAHKPEEIKMIGINGKNSELHAAIGLSILPYVPSLIKRRKKICSSYDNKLSKVFKRPSIPKSTTYNYSYYPLLFSSEKRLKEAIKKLKAADIHPRRYFYPSLNTLTYIKPQRVDISESISKRVLCLPLSHDLSESVINKICKILLSND